MSFTIIKKLLVSLLFLSACNMSCMNTSLQELVERVNAEKKASLDTLKSLRAKRNKLEALIGDLWNKEEGIEKRIAHFIPKHENYDANAPADVMEWFLQAKNSENQNVRNLMNLLISTDEKRDNLEEQLSKLQNEIIELEKKLRGHSNNISQVTI